jgi:hypothetical protein
MEPAVEDDRLEEARHEAATVVEALGKHDEPDVPPDWHTGPDGVPESLGLEEDELPEWLREPESLAGRDEEEYPDWAASDDRDLAGAGTLEGPDWLQDLEWEGVLEDDAANMPSWRRDEESRQAILEDDEELPDWFGSEEEWGEGGGALEGGGQTEWSGERSAHASLHDEGTLELPDWLAREIGSPQPGHAEGESGVSPGGADADDAPRAADDWL